MKHENYIAREDKITIPVTEYKELLENSFSMRILKMHLQRIKSFKREIDISDVMFFLREVELRDCNGNEKSHHGGNRK